MTEIEARTIPRSIAICPICGKGLWIESIEQASQDEGDRWIPDQVSLTCETEPDIDSDEWREWHQWHFSTPYVDWLPVTDKVLDWLQHPKRRQRFETIWNAGHAMMPGGV